MRTTYPHGSRFHPTELGLVKLHLNEKVENNNSGFIKTLNVYGDAPWLLNHDTNPLYCRNEWYYFVPRTIRGVKTVSRMVPRNDGESFLGGTWKSIGKRKEIKNRAKELKGYKRELVFNKNVVGKLEKEKTDWHMDEYSLHKNGDEFHDLVLCHIRLLNSAERFKPRVPAAHQVDHENNDNNVSQNQEQQEAGDADQQQQEQEDSRIPLHPPLQSNNNNQGQYLLEASVYQNDMMIPENDRGYLNQQQQQQDLEDAYIPAQHSLQMNNNLEPSPFDDNAYHGAENDMTGYGLMANFNDVNQQQYEQQQDSPTLPFQSNYNQRQYLLEDIVNQTGTMVLKNDPGYLNPHQQQQQQDQEGSHIQFADLADRTELMPNSNEGNDVNQQHEQQQDSPTLLVDPLQSNDKQEHYPPGDTAFEGVDDGLTFDLRELWESLNEGKEQEEAGFASLYDMWMMVEKGHDDDFKQDPQYQEKLHEYLGSFQLDDFGFDGAGDGWLEQLRKMEEERLSKPGPQAQDSGVHEDQVMPKD